MLPLAETPESTFGFSPPAPYLLWTFLCSPRLPVSPRHRLRIPPEAEHARIARRGTWAGTKNGNGRAARSASGLTAYWCELRYCNSSFVKQQGVIRKYIYITVQREKLTSTIARLSCLLQEITRRECIKAQTPSAFREQLTWIQNTPGKSRGSCSTSPLSFLPRLGHLGIRVTRCEVPGFVSLGCCIEER